MTLNTLLQEHHFKHLDKNMATIKHSNAMSKQRNESHRQYLLLLQLPDTDKFDVILKRSKVVKVDLEKAEVLIDEVQEFLLCILQTQCVPSRSVWCLLSSCTVALVTSPKPNQDCRTSDGETLHPAGRHHNVIVTGLLSQPEARLHIWQIRESVLVNK